MSADPRLARMLAPSTDADAARMVRGIRSLPILTGARGTERSDVGAIEDALIRLGVLGFDFPEIQELDLNPVFVHDEGHGITVADARIRVGPTPGPAARRGRRTGQMKSAPTTPKP